MINKIELKLIDDKGNYSIARIDYKGFVDTLTKHNVDIVKDALDAMVKDYIKTGKMEIKSDVPNRIYSDTCSVITYDEDNERMDIIGQNGNEGLHYVSNEEADEDARMNIQDKQHRLDGVSKHERFRQPHKN
jgi:hypothetical protein